MVSPRYSNQKAFEVATKPPLRITKQKQLRCELWRLLSEVVVPEFQDMNFRLQRTLSGVLLADYTTAVEEVSVLSICYTPTYYVKRY